METKEWVKDNVYLNPDGDLYLIEPSKFGKMKKPVLLLEDKYICHRDIELCDKNGSNVFIGDYVRAQVKDGYVTGLVCFAHEMSAYIILCADIDKYFILGSEVCDRIEIIGNVFDGYEDKHHDNESL